jgi:DNA repair protein RadC
MLLLGSGVAGRPVAAVAQEVLSHLDRRNAAPEPDELVCIPGLGPARAAALCAAFELARRVLCPARRKVRAPADVLPLLDRFSDRDQEHFLVINLNGAHEVTALRTVSVGLVNRTMVHPREVFAHAIAERASAVILAHNHPSGSVDPSAEDHDITRRLLAAGETLGIPVLDHVIFSTGGYWSFLEHNAL